MYWRREMAEANKELYVVHRRFKIENFQKIVDELGREEICQAYKCETLLKGGDGYFYLVDKVDDVKLE